MAVNPKIVLMALEAAGSEKIRKIVMYVVFFTLGLIMLVYVAYATIISGILSFFQTEALKSQWSAYENAVSGLFGNVTAEVDADIKSDVIKFMPDFSYNLSRAIISESTGDDTLKVFDDAELSAARAIMKAKAVEMRKITTEKEWNDFFLGSAIKPSFSEIKQTEFLNDNGIQNIGKYSQSIRDYLYSRAGNSRKEYKYFEEQIEIDGNRGTRQTLEIWGADGGLEQRVELNLIGGGIYLPELLAMYNTSVVKDSLSDELLNERIGEVMGSVPQTSNEYLAFSLSVLEYAVLGGDEKAPDVYKNNSIKSAIEKAEIKSVCNSEIDFPDARNCTITLKLITSDTWQRIFGLDESLMPYVMKTREMIETSLRAAQIPRERWYADIDGLSQPQYFERFGGLLGISLDAGVNPRISSIYGNVSELHEHNGGGAFENGLTLSVNQKSGIYIGIQPGCDKFVTDAFIYDVWDMDQRDLSEESKLYNRSAVTMAYIIDLKKFESAYGFAFPAIEGLDRSSGFATVFVEISCLSGTELQASSVGKSISVNFSDRLYVGNAHAGKVDDNHDKKAYSHAETNQGVCPRHFSVRVNIIGGKAEKPKYDEKQTEYKGLTAENMGVSVNPAFLLKGLVNDTVFPGIYDLQPK